MSQMKDLLLSGSLDFGVNYPNGSKCKKDLIKALIAQTVQHNSSGYFEEMNDDSVLDEEYFPELMIDYYGW